MHTAVPSKPNAACDVKPNPFAGAASSRATSRPSSASSHRRAPNISTLSSPMGATRLQRPASAQNLTRHSSKDHGLANAGMWLQRPASASAEQHVATRRHIANLKTMLASPRNLLVEPIESVALCGSRSCGSSAPLEHSVSTPSLSAAAHREAPVRGPAARRPAPQLVPMDFRRNRKKSLMEALDDSDSSSDSERNSAHNSARSSMTNNSTAPSTTQTSMAAMSSATSSVVDRSKLPSPSAGASAAIQALTGVGFNVPSRPAADTKSSNKSRMKVLANYDKIRNAVFRAERRQILAELRLKYAAAEWYVGTSSDLSRKDGIARQYEEERHQAFVDLDAPTAPLEAAAARAPSKFKEVEDAKARPLERSAPEWWAVPKPVVLACEKFDGLVARRLMTAHQLNGMVDRDIEGLRVASALRASVRSVRRTRYCEPTVLETVKVYAKREKKKKVVVVEKPPGPWWPGIWAPRATWCDGKDYYDHTQVRQQRFDIDWACALKEVNLIKVVMRADDGDDDGVEDEDGDGIPDEVEEVGDLLWEHSGWLYQLFLSYAAALDTLG